jgi:Flp pilus assembly protein protease CpaA
MNPLSLVLVAPVCFAAVCDLRSREIPDWIPLVIVGWACLATAASLQKLTWLGMAFGVLLAAIVVLPLFYAGAWGGGDAKLLIALGLAVGPVAFLSILAWMAVAGGALALVAMARKTREFAYGPAIAFGLLVETLWPGGLARVLLG